jgi:iron complex transport system permease protein
VIGLTRAAAARGSARAEPGLARPARPVLVLGGLTVALLFVSVLAIGLGEEYISPGSVLGMALQWLPVHPARDWSTVDETIITLYRLPQVITAIMVGAGLATAGTAFQALFRNPLADPGIVGTSAGASLGAILALSLPIQIEWLGYSIVSVAAFLGAMTTMLLVYSLARVGGKLPSTQLLLAGFAVSAGLNAAATMVETMSDRLRQMYVWLLGNLDQTTNTQLLTAAPVFILGIAGLLLLAGDLNVMLLGEDQSLCLGMDIHQRRLVILVLGSLLTSTAVALGGMIAFVGLLVPHITRMLFGANHRLLLPASALMGAMLMVVVNTVAHLVLAPQVLPVGLITAMLGAPWFLVLLRRKKGAYTF